MKVYEFWLKDECKSNTIQSLATAFLRLHDDVFSVSRNPKTHWVQVLARDKLPSATESILLSRIDELSENTQDIQKYASAGDSLAPMERRKEQCLLSKL